jgi:hypothetical protein
MTQYDAAATPMWRAFTAAPDLNAYGYLPARVNLNDLNPDKTKLALLSKGLDFSDADLVPDQVMNNILWKAVKGEDAEAPAPVRAAFFKQAAGGDKD